MRNILRFLRNRTYPIGMDMSDDAVRMAQLANNSAGGISLIAGGSENRPAAVKPGSSSWQRWAIEAIKKMTANGGFRGRNVIAAMPANEVFVDHIEVPQSSDGELTSAVFSKIKQKLPFDSAEAMIKYIPMEKDNVLVVAADRKKVDRHLAIYERANLQINAICIWPIALTNSYIRFFGRRKSDIEAIVMLACMESNYTNVVICRHKNLLFARSIPIGAEQLDAGEMLTRLALELTGCRRHFGSMYKNSQIERLIFLSSGAVDTKLCTTIARQLEMPAQMGDCLAAVEMAEPYGQGSAIDRRNSQVNWATAFGLSLS